MNRRTRSKTKKQEMASDSAADSSTKLDDILAKMDVLIQAKDQMLCKLNKVEQIQSSIVQDVDKLKERMKTANLSIQESEAKLKTKADQSDLDILKSKMDDLENRSKRNNVVVWGVKEGCESDFRSIEEFIEKELFTHHHHRPHYTSGGPYVNSFHFARSFATCSICVHELKPSLRHSLSTVRRQVVLGLPLLLLPSGLHVKDTLA